MADKDKEKTKIDLGLLEEDDEFEEFPAEGRFNICEWWLSFFDVPGYVYIHKQNLNKST